MDYFEYKDDEAYCEDVPLKQIAQDFGTPCYVYSKKTLQRHLQRIKNAFQAYPTLPCFAVKANSNLSILKEIFTHGYGADLVSIGELQRSLKSGVSADKIVFSGVGKRDDEILAALETGILSFNVESSFELTRIAQLAEQVGKVAPICLRVNPNIDAKTNPKIATGLFSTKFGIVEAEVHDLCKKIKEIKSLKLVGIACHIGSQITDISPMQEAAQKMAKLAIEISSTGHELQYLNMGGGLGIRYKDEPQPSVEEYAEMLIKEIKPTGLKLIIEPGRVLVGNIGILLTQVIGIKTTPQKKFAIVDGAMNDIIRPSLYDSYHEILTVDQRHSQQEHKYDVVGPVCETGDFFGKDRSLQELNSGDLLYLRGCGAYSSSMASNYNSRPRAPEILIDGSESKLIKEREKTEDLWRGEFL